MREPEVPETRLVRLSDVVVPDNWMDDLDDANIGHLAQQLRAGRVLPPIKVKDDNTLVLGRHRLAAHFSAGIPLIRADVVSYDSALDEEEDVICENLRRRVPPGPERDAKLARLVEIERIRRGADSSDKAPRPSAGSVASAVAARAGVSQSTVQRAVDKQKPPKQLDVRMPDGSRYQPEGSAWDAVERPAEPPPEPPKPPHMQALYLLKASLDLLPGLTGNVDRAEELVGPMLVKNVSGAPPVINGVISAVRAVQAKLEMCRSDLEYAVRELNGIEAALRRTNEPRSPDEPLPGERRAPKTGLRGARL